MALEPMAPEGVTESFVDAIKVFHGSLSCCRLGHAGGTVGRGRWGRRQPSHTSVIRPGASAVRRAATRRSSCCRCSSCCST